MTHHPSIILKELELADVPKVHDFTDQWIGKNYYKDGELKEILLSSQGTSFGAWHNGQLQGIRLTLAPGEVMKFIKRGLSTELWPCGPESMAYFKSLFVAEDAQGKGVGISLSEKSMDVLRKLGARAIVCHSWLESPGNSSQRYLKKLGFKEVHHHKKFWFPIDYDCTRCSPNKCVCTAVEMVREL